MSYYRQILFINKYKMLSGWVSRPTSQRRLCDASGWESQISRGSFFGFSASQQSEIQVMSRQNSLWYRKSETLPGIGTNRDILLLTFIILLSTLNILPKTGLFSLYQVPVCNLYPDTFVMILINLYGEPQNPRWDIPCSVIIKAMHPKRTSYDVSINKRLTLIDMGEGLKHPSVLLDYTTPWLDKLCSLTKMKCSLLFDLEVFAPY